MTECVEQQYCIKFCQKFGDYKAETIWKIHQAFSDDAMVATQTKEWFNHFKDGRTLADSDQRSGRPSTSRNASVIENVRSLILEDRHLTVQEIADEVGISTGSAHSIVTEDLHMCKVVAKFVPKLLSQEQQQFWVISVYFNIRNTLPKYGTFLLGHPVYINTNTQSKISLLLFTKYLLSFICYTENKYFPQLQEIVTVMMYL
jgi:hypothetical protein